MILILPTVNSLSIKLVGRGSSSSSSLASSSSSLPSSSLPSPPTFYSEIISPLGQIAAYYVSSEDKVQVPEVIDMDLPEYEPLTTHLLLNNNNDNKEQTHEKEKDEEIQLIVTTATFAGGCFWGVQLAFDREPGVLATCVGYTQGTTIFPTYSDVCSSPTNISLNKEEHYHTEACLVAYNPTIVSYERLAELLFDRIPDPTMLNRVGKDRGIQYRTGLYAHSDEQLVMAQTAFDRENKMWFGREVVTEVKRATLFWPAEEVHQQYLEKGGRFGRSQSSHKKCCDEIRCYG
eukprot:CAMPEP_0170886750 /NCGR_PEP_ID=MMETSP0734-20130129/37029_1 /TAXON_ID=186038 /ORGANISM="Fragilariopsis kerguelensis, Strain L26-C5" /LENGTH=289 /DNA_ID=CAMNT_0011273149 /DNA_START=156 /DNA_END=1025 /DNA_ORIENTATION=-